MTCRLGTVVRSVGIALLVFGIVFTSDTARAQRPGASKPAADSTVTNPYANSWALIIGINRYGKVPGLNYAVADAKSVAEAIPSLGFPKKNTRVLLDAEATKAAVERVLYRDFQAMGADDRLLVYFAGHGVTAPIKGGEEGYILPVEADPAFFAQTAIPMEEVRRIGQRVKAKHVLFVMDACFSGFATTRDIAPAKTTDDYLAAALREPVVQVITAGRKGDQAIEDAGHGLFTRRFLDGLRILSNDGIVTVAQLAAWIEPRVVRDSHGKMTPQYGRLDGEGQFVFVRSAGPATDVTAASPPRPAVLPNVGSLAIKGRLAGIDVWLDGKKIGTTQSSSALVLEALPPKTYTVMAKKSGHKQWERTVDVIADRRVELMIDIEPLAAAPVIKTEDGAEMVLVPAGEFWMGSDWWEFIRVFEACKKFPSFDDAACRDRFARESPRHRVFLDGFYIDQYEVTNAQFRRFVRATGHVTLAESQGFSQVLQNNVWVKVPGAKWERPKGPGSSSEANHPVGHTSWRDAEAYCRWAGKRLPTEAEWEKAARGTDGRQYPWGDTWDKSRVEWGNGTHAVGSAPQGISPYGAHDMAGNVLEWVADWFDKDYYKQSPDRNPKGPTSGQGRAARGGYFGANELSMRTAYRLFFTAGTSEVHGFRCAKEVDAPK